MRLGEVEATLNRLPRFRGAPLKLQFRKPLRDERGEEVDGASDIRRRHILLDSRLGPRDLRRVLTHELFHFAWVRLGNPGRRSWEGLLREEDRRSARGELGWSAEVRKGRLGKNDVSARSRAWREYVCESFCDTAAFLYGCGSNGEVELAQRFRERRFAWFRNQLESESIGI